MRRTRLQRSHQVLIPRPRSVVASLLCGISVAILSTLNSCAADALVGKITSLDPPDRTILYRCLIRPGVTKLVAHVELKSDPSEMVEFVPVLFVNGYRFESPSIKMSPGGSTTGAIDWRIPVRGAVLDAEVRLIVRGLSSGKSYCLDSQVRSYPVVKTCCRRIGRSCCR